MLHHCLGKMQWLTVVTHKNIIEEVKQWTPYNSLKFMLLAIRAVENGTLK